MYHVDFFDKHNYFGKCPGVWDIRGIETVIEMIQKKKIAFEYVRRAPYHIRRDGARAGGPSCT